MWLDVNELVVDAVNEEKVADRIEDWGRGIWRPVTALEANAWQARRYRSSL